MNSRAPVGSIGNYCTLVISHSTVVPNTADRSSAVQKVPSITEERGVLPFSIRIYVYILQSLHKKDIYNPSLKKMKDYDSVLLHGLATIC